MKIEQVKKLSPEERFIYWIRERWQVHLRRRAGLPKPWTDDEILQSYRFCNVRRMDDKVSQWLLNNWYEPNFGHRNMLVAVGLARFINNPASLGLVGFPKRWKPERIKRILRDYKRQGNVVFNAAYMVRGNDGEDKIDSVVSHYVEAIRKVDVDSSSLEQTHGGLCECYGMGSFMAGQIVADLRWAVPGTWEDKDNWAPIGPGSRRGMNRLLGLHSKNPMNQETFLGNLTEVIFKLSGLGLTPGLNAPLEAHDYQNCFCEYDKYTRALLGEGRPKQRYRGVDAECL